MRYNVIIYFHVPVSLNKQKVVEFYLIQIITFVQ